jgi:hypothetical protein
MSEPTDTGEPEASTQVRVVVPLPAGYTWFVQNGQLSLPSGEVGAGEGSIEAAQRIAEEQLGLRVEVRRWLGDLGAQYLMALPNDGVPRADAIKLPLGDAIERLNVFDQAAIGGAAEFQSKPARAKQDARQPAVG